MCQTDAWCTGARPRAHRSFPFPKSAPRFAEKNAKKSGSRRAKSESSRSASDTATDYECIDRRINNGRITGDTRADRSLDFRPFFSLPFFFFWSFYRRRNARCSYYSLFQTRHRTLRRGWGLIKCFFNCRFVFVRDIYRGEITHEKKVTHTTHNELLGNSSMKSLTQSHHGES